MCIDAQILMRSSAENKNLICQMTTYFRVIQEIIILDYYFVEYPLFKSVWVDVHDKNGMKIDEIDFKMVNLKRPLSKDSARWSSYSSITSETCYYGQDPVENN